MLLILLTWLLTSASWAQVEVMKLDFDLGARTVHNSDSNRTRSQARVRVGFAIDMDGKFELVGFASTGTDFDSTWASVTDTQHVREGHTMVFRRLYVRKQIDNVNVEAGALEPMPTPVTGREFLYHSQC